MAVQIPMRLRPPTRHRARGRATITLGLLLAMSGCQALVPTALPTTFGLGENAKIAKQAKADSFPSPADVGLTTASSDSEL
jgi:hypothetical protein